MPEANMKLSFMTWVTPKWGVDEIIGAARRHGYQGVEIRVESNHAHGIERTASPESAKTAGLRFREAGIELCCIATSCRFAIADPAERARQTEDLLAYIELAHIVGCSRLRVFGGNMPDGVEPAGAIDWVADAISEAMEAAEQKRVSILLETHDSFSRTHYVREVMRQLYSDYVGVVWDIIHPLRHLENVQETFDNIAPYIRHCHVHDMAYNEDRTKLNWAEPGAGIAPFSEAVQLLAAHGFSGYLSVEVMEGDPDGVLAAYADFLRKRMEEASGS
ncbi:MAG TPA: sugar phosphate isomerase/epimerase [Planctomycetes bacterium]|nr:sugar phosphate isomerase/epimerase [Planctomycetota bacterium]